MIQIGETYHNVLTLVKKIPRFNLYEFLCPRFAQMFDQICIRLDTVLRAFFQMK